MTATSASILAVDTSSVTASVALIKNSKKSIVFRKSHGAQKHAEFLNQSLSEILIEAGAELNEVDTLLYNCGPGSFTGLRVGAAFMKALAFAKKAKVHSLTTPQIIAASQGGIGEFYYIEDAQNSEKFFAELSGLNLKSPITLVRKNMSPNISENSKSLTRAESFVGAVTLIETFINFPNIFQTFDWNSLHPLYLKASAAEELLILRK